MSLEFKENTIFKLFTVYTL